MTSTKPPTAAPPADPGRRYSIVALIGAGLAGVALGAAAAFLVTGLVFTIRVELPQPPYPQLSTTPSVSLPALPPVSSAVPTPAPSLVPVPPPLPMPGPH